MEKKNVDQQKQIVKEPQATKKYRPSSLPLADLIRSINEANKPRSKSQAIIEHPWQGEQPEPPLAA